MNYDEFLTTLLGGAIAGGVGIVTVWYVQRLADKRRLNEETLEPAFDYVHGLPTGWPWLSLGDPVWKQFERHRWYRIPLNVREELGELESRIDLHGRSTQRYWDVMRAKGDESFGASVRDALSKFLSPDGQSIKGQAIGLGQDVPILVQDLVNGVVSPVLMHPNEQDEAWKLLDAVGPGSYYWAKRAIRGLQNTDRATLTKLFDVIARDASQPETRPVVQSAYEAFERVVEQAKLVQADLASRLGFKVASTT